jgi:crossover junction endodeoxyribonuclease RuvC
MRVMGVDPGLAITGYGIIDSVKSKMNNLCHGAIRTKPDLPIQERLRIIYEELTEIIKTHSPDAVAVEELFFNRNVNSAFAVGMARGVVLLSAEMSSIPIGSYTPLQVKQSIVGYGRATKNQIQQMVKVILGLPDIPKPVDAADALAIAICHVNSYRFSELAGSSIKSGS